MQGRGCRKTDFNRIKTFDYFFVFTYKIILIPVKKFCLGKFPIKSVTAMSFINDNSVKITGRRNAFFVIAHNAGNHSLDCCNLDAGFRS